MELYPYLKELLGGYFHQDAYDEGRGDENIMRDFRATSHEYQRLGARADIRRLLHQHEGQLVAVIGPYIAIGETEAEVAEWLEKIDKLLDENRP